MTTWIYCSKCGKEMWTDWSNNLPVDEVADESVICADCMKGKKTKGFTTTVSHLFGRLFGRERTAEVTDMEQAVALILEGVRLLIQAVEFDSRLGPFVKEAIQVLREGALELAEADSGENF